MKVAVVKEIGGAWFGGGHVSATGRSVWFPLPDVTATELVAHLATEPDVPPVVAIPPVNLVDLPADVLA